LKAIVIHLIKNSAQKLKRETIYAWRQSKEIISLNENFFRNAKGCRIVCYHGICERDHLKFNNIFLRRDTFEKHLQFYKKYFNVVSLDDFFKKNFDENKFTVCITFDDGYYNNYKYVLPLMEAYKTPVTFFITAIQDAGYNILWNDFLGIATKYGPEEIDFNGETFFKKNNNYISTKTKRPLAEILRKQNFTAKQNMMKTFAELVFFRDKKEDEDFWQQMNTEDIKRLSSSSQSTIGAHGYYHNDLSEISIDDCKKELAESKSFLEKVCEKKIDALAFPYGHYSRQVVAEAKKAGYDKLLALDFHFEEDKNNAAMRQRMIINPYISVVNQMYAIVKGKYE
jgi:peptidoglycan/xylan/chitin deacetylase (PgdA/CDA1 family)